MPASSGQPYIIAACIGAVPATVASVMAYFSLRNARKENKTDHSTVIKSVDSLTSAVGVLQGNVAQTNVAVERQELHFERMDVRFDGIEDKVERHLGWHRGIAAGNLSEALDKETSDAHHHTNND